MARDAPATQKKHKNQQKTHDRSASSKDAHDSSHGRSKNRRPEPAEKENLSPSDDEVTQLRERNKQLEQLCQSNGVSVPTAVNGVADRSIPRPRNMKKDVNVSAIRAHMGIEDAGGKRVWLNCRQAVRNNLPRAGFDYDVDFASQEKLKIEHERPLFKRFKASWGAEYVLREVWSNRNEWFDKTNNNPPKTANDDDDDGDSNNENHGDNDSDLDDDAGQQDRATPQPVDESTDEGPSHQRPSRKRAHELSPASSESEQEPEALRARKRTKRSSDVVAGRPLTCTAIV
ncbi:hypothetical protein R3P38DRAFT_3193512 [Favolaschia claudopus]|uniref:Uncharacterized protein n=1 Tax=Favolaschia claudopus TaxID=2862362 RepID=A0AAW0BH02_9AGAR